MSDKTQPTSGSSAAAFPTTQWNILASIRADAAGTHRTELLEFLIRRYWRPVYVFVRRLGQSHEDACDAVQGFFSRCLEQDLFARADPTVGRFRTYLLRSFKNYLQNVHRAASAKRRRPTAGLVSLDALMDAEGPTFEPRAGETPEDVFNRAWATEFIERVVRVFERECRATNKTAHYELLQARIIRPALEGAPVPSLRSLAQQMGLAEKQASNCLLAARRVFQRLLRQEVLLHVSSENEATAEIRELFGAFGSA